MMIIERWKKVHWRDGQAFQLLVDDRHLESYGPVWTSTTLCRFDEGLAILFWRLARLNRNRSPFRSLLHARRDRLHRERALL